MNKIASISRDKHPSIEPLWQIGKREILISSYYLRRGRQQNISKINNEGCNIIAIDRGLRQKSRLRSPLFVSEGKLLTLALLPAILDKQRPAWLEENIAINCNGLAGFLATLRLLTETRHHNRHRTSSIFFERACFAQANQYCQRRYSHRDSRGPADYSQRHLSA